MEGTSEMTVRGYAGVPWWVVLIEGMAAIIIGIMLFASPAATSALLVQILGWYWLIGGIMGLVMMFVDTRLWGWKLVGGLLGIFAGILIIQNPLWATIAAPAVFVIILGIDGVLIGIVDLIKAFQGAGWGVGVLGVLSLLLGAYLIFNPLSAVVALPYVLGFLAVVGGVIAIWLSISMRREERIMGGEMRRAA